MAEGASMALSWAVLVSVTQHPKEAAPESPRRLGRDFSMVWAGQSISSVGTAVTYLALPLLAVLDFHASAWQVGLLSAATYAAYAVLALPLGAWLDRRSRRPLVILGDVGRLVAIGSVPVAQAFGVLSFAQLIIVAAAVGVFTVLFDIAYQSWLPEIVDPSLLLRANSRTGATEAVGLLAGPGVAGVLVAAIGAAYTLGVDAVSFAVAAATTVAVVTREAPPVAAGPISVRAQVREGFAWLRNSPVLKWVTACSTMANLFIAMEAAVATLFLVRTLHTGPAVIGVVAAIGGSGGILGALLADTTVTRLGTVLTLALTTSVGGALELIGPLGSPALGPWAVAIGLFGLSGTNAIYNAAAISRRQQDAPRAMLARVTSANRVFSYGALPLGALTGGLLAAAIGYRATLVVAALGYGLAAVWFLPTLRTRTHITA